MDASECTGWMICNSDSEIGIWIRFQRLSGDFQGYRKHNLTDGLLIRDWILFPDCAFETSYNLLKIIEVIIDEPDYKLWWKEIQVWASKVRKNPRLVHPYLFPNFPSVRPSLHVSHSLLPQLLDLRTWYILHIFLLVSPPIGSDQPLWAAGELFIL